MKYSIMMSVKPVLVTMLLCSVPVFVSASELDESEMEGLSSEFKSILIEGEKNFNDESLSTNGLACGQCHIEGENIYPETYPKYKGQIGRVVTIGQMINWCIVNPLKGRALKPDSRTMVSLISYVLYQRRDVKLDPGRE